MELLKKDFGAAYKKLTENGVDCLMACPFGKNNRYFRLNNSLL